MKPECSIRMTAEKYFTIIELLVVIAIIVVLASLLFPALTKAKAQARKITCLGNERQLTTAYLYYDGDYNQFPPGDGDGQHYLQIGSIGDYIKFNNNYGTHSVLYCASADDSYHSDPCADYLVNPATNSVPNLAGGEWQQSARNLNNTFYDLEDCIMTADPAPAGMQRQLTDVEVVRDILTEWTYNNKTVKFTHGSSINVGYMDGHAENKSVLHADILARYFETTWGTGYNSVWHYGATAAYH